MSSLIVVGATSVATSGTTVCSVGTNSTGAVGCSSAATSGAASTAGVTVESVLSTLKSWEATSPAKVSSCSVPAKGSLGLARRIEATDLKPPPRRPPAIADCLYSSKASSVSIGSPACARSSICWPTSVRLSVAAPVVAPVPTRTNIFLICEGSIRRPIKKRSAIVSKAAWPTAACSAFPKSTFARRPAATSSS